MRILFLDDDESRHHTFKRHSIGHDVTFVFDAGGAIAALEAAAFDLVYLDHDLGGPASQNRLDYAFDGRHVARWVADHASAFASTKFLIHSLNYAGAEGMMWTLRDTGLTACVRPFAWTKSPEEIYEHIRIYC